ncbi:MAG: amine oxidase [Micavibrio aeruginosavorus]|uniref:Amine oxidase n=1 Tax=Micavibrio aeruginosavorus TaxID=349221 RepID=A0A2W4ZU51_9BACT|nr:MAG: amine oxidase [Micavibrio aeruginosavorus]
MKIAIIGSGISGLGAAWLLRHDHDVTVFEKNDYLGGHSRTIDVKTPGGTVPVDTGFIVFNDWNYPNLFSLFDRLNVPYEKSDMSFGVRIGDFLEYSSNGLFTQKLNFFRPAYWRMIFDIMRFNKHAESYLDKDPSITLGQCLDELKMGEWFRQYYLLAMGAAIWSCPIKTILKFPAATYVRFFKNHGLLNINHRPQWYTVKGGSREYVRRLAEDMQSHIKCRTAIKSVVSEGGHVKLTDGSGAEHIFDQVIFACHPDEAMAMIQNPAPETRSVIGSFRYQENKIVVHSDLSFMPVRRKCWASWIYLNDTPKDEKPAVSLSYWMNNLQGLSTPTDVLVTLNPGRAPADGLVYDEHVFHHPVFDEAAIVAQSRIDSIQGKDGFWFCGAYQRYGFHEDGLWSAVNVARKMGTTIPWH